MAYVNGMLIPVPVANKAAYIERSQKMSAMWIALGATRCVASWGDGLAHGKTNDFYTAVIAKDDENVVLVWIEWPDKAAHDAGMAKMRSDPAVEPTEALPFDGARMIFGGFDTIVDIKD